MPRPPALLSRRSSRCETDCRIVLRSDSPAAVARCDVEMERGRVVIALEPAPANDVAIQWRQGGVPIRGETASELHLHELTPADSDLFDAVLTSSGGTSTSQPLLLVVAPGQRIVNFSVRGQIGGDASLTLGFVVARGTAANPKRYLIRALGPSLARLGIANPSLAPSVRLYRRGIDCSDRLQPDTDRAFSHEWGRVIGAFALDATSTDYVAVAELTAGAYTVVATQANATPAEALLEVYETPAPSSGATLP